MGCKKTRKKGNTDKKITQIADRHTRLEKKPRQRPRNKFSRGRPKGGRGKGRGEGKKGWQIRGGPEKTWLTNNLKNPREKTDERREECGTALVPGKKEREKLGARANPLQHHLGRILREKKSLQGMIKGTRKRNHAP